jgi:hypothetical protein
MFPRVEKNQNDKLLTITLIALRAGTGHLRRRGYFFETGGGFEWFVFKLHHGMKVALILGANDVSRR